RSRNHLEHDRERARVFDCVSVGEKLFERVTATLDDVPTQLVLTLRGEADVSHDGNSGIHNAANLLSAANTTLELDSVGVGLFHEPESRVKCFFWAALVRAEGHIRDDERTGNSPSHCASQRNQLINGHR